MRVERTAAQAGKVLPATEHTCFAEAGEEGFRVSDDTFRIVGYHTGAHHFGGSSSTQIEHGGKGDVETEQAELRADEVAVRAAESSAAGRGDDGWRGHGCDEVAKAIDEAALDIDGMKDGTIADEIRNALKQSVDLRRFFDVAAEEHGTGRLDEAQPSALRSVEFCPGKSNEE
jgi:hypothetical protein